jgi:hypothetical protein
MRKWLRAQGAELRVKKKVRVPKVMVNLIPDT